MSLKDLRKRLAGKYVETQPLKTRVGDIIDISVKELREAAESHPGHPKSPIYLRACEGKPDQKTLYVEKQDLEAMLDDADVEDTFSVDERSGTVTIRKVVIRKEIKKLSSPEIPEPLRVSEAYDESVDSPLASFDEETKNSELEEEDEFDEEA